MAKGDDEEARRIFHKNMDNPNFFKREWFKLLNNLFPPRIEDLVPDREPEEYDPGKDLEEMQKEDKAKEKGPEKTVTEAEASKKGKKGKGKT